MNLSWSLPSSSNSIIRRTHLSTAQVVDKVAMVSKSEPAKDKTGDLKKIIESRVSTTDAEKN